MKKIVAGIVAHVDAGKTTLSEAMLYQAGMLRQLGRVDNGDAFLDPDDLEKQRGITIFSHEAQFQYQDLAVTLLDTPGHVDFASQTEQVLSVLDYAVLVVAATDGIQGYTRTLWRLLEQYQVPTFIFVNKMDAPGTDEQWILNQLKTELATGCVAFDDVSESLEEIAMQSDDMLDEYLASDALTTPTIQQAIAKRLVFPVYFGAALKLDGVATLLAGLKKWSVQTQTEREFGARVFKISHDAKGERLTWIRLTGGRLQPRQVIVDEQKINQIRVYNGTKFTIQSEISAGQVCTLTGLTQTYPGQGLGQTNDERSPLLQPVLNYTVIPNGNDIQTCLAAFKELEDEDPQLHVTWSEQLQEIRIQVMGVIQLEVLRQLLIDRFDLTVEFGEGSILYKETITEPMEGVGHFEPLRHYAEVHLLMEPAPRGSGISFQSDCAIEVLDRNWQHQILTALQAKEHRGVLIGAPITDIKVTLINGRASNVHTVGGDFREATWRALRQGLMMLKQRGALQLLEPWYQFRLTIPADQIGRAMTDIQRMQGQMAPLVTDDPNEEMTTITGTAPVATMQTYVQEVNAYTHGQGQLECVFAGYQPCHDEKRVVEDMNYNPVGDLANTPDSVFCAHGAGYPVTWDQVPQMSHVDYQKN